MTAHSPRDVMHLITEKWKTYRSSRAALAELEVLPADVVASLASDVGLTPAELHHVVRHGHGADELMLRMLAAFGIDADALRRNAPGLLRDVSVSCSTCGDKSRCRRELDGGTARQNAAEFCPNQPTFAAVG